MVDIWSGCPWINPLNTDDDKCHVDWLNVWHLIRLTWGHHMLRCWRRTAAITMDLALAPLELATFKLRGPLVVCKFSDFGLEVEDVSEAGELEDPRRCRRCRQPRTWCGVFYLVLALICASSLAAVIVIGLVISVPYTWTRNFKGTTCQAVSFYHTTDTLMCTCGRRCRSSYPCLNIEVVYQFYDNINRSSIGILRENDFALNRKVCSGLPKIFHDTIDRKADVNSLKAFALNELTYELYLRYQNGSFYVMHSKFDSFN